MELALRLKELEIAVTFGWISTSRGFTCLVSQGFVDLADQPGEGAAVDGLGQGIPGVGCLLQVQGTHQLQAEHRKALSSPHTKGSPPFSCLIITEQPLKIILDHPQWDPCSANLLRGDGGAAGRADSLKSPHLPNPQSLLLPPLL